MLILKDLLENLVKNKSEICCLCFKDIKSSKIGFEDEIVLLENTTTIATKVFDIMSYVFGPEILQTVTAFENICEQCTTSLTMCYKFIRECKETANYVDLIIGTITDSLETCEASEENKTFYLTVNNDLSIAHFFCDSKLKDKRKSSAYKQLKNILNPNLNSFKIEKEDVKTGLKNHENTKGIALLKIKDEVKCNVCMKSFLSLACLHKHYTRVHSEKTEKCPKCEKRFPTTTLLNKHIKNAHQDFVCSTCGKNFNNYSSFKTHEKNHQTLYVCDDCGRIYKNNNTFRLHIENNVCQSEARSTPAIGKYVCDYCQKRYSQKMTLRVHIQHEHLNYKSHFCKWCNKKFSCQSRLKAHEVTHTKEKKFVCTICNGKYVTKESLLYHTRLHTGEKPYQCGLCNARFLSASRRLIHVKSHHNTDNTVRPVTQTVHECNICQRKFANTTYLQKHMKTHAPVKVQEGIVKSIPSNVHILDCQNLQIGSENVLFFDPNEKQDVEVEIPQSLSQVESVEIVYNDDMHLEKHGDIYMEMNDKDGKYIVKFTDSI